MASSSRSEKRCLYEILDVTKESTPEEIRSSYRRLALQRHPDKLIKAGGISEADATAQFQELVHAYEVLSDPKERAWYDSHRSQILFADGGGGGSKSRGMPGATVPDLFAFFSTTVYSGYSDTGKGFYKVYYDVFNSVYLNEIKFARTLGLSIDSVREAPIMGNLESPYTQVTAFYNYWLGFSTVLDFCWVDEYDTMAGPNRRMRRKMEEENKKVRKKAKREYNETVRGLAAFVKKRDKRVVDMMVKKSAEMELKKEEERERKKKMEKERLEKAMNYEEPDWAKAEDEEEVEEEEVGGEGEDGKKKNEQLYCIVCSKKFKSEKQWKNHEQSKKHKEKVAELRETFSDVEEEEEVDEMHETVEELKELNMDNEEEEVEEGVVDETDDEYCMAEEDLKGSSESEDEEMSLLKEMVQKNKRKNVVPREEEDEVHVEIESDSEFDSQKSTTERNRKNKKERSKRNAGKDTTDDDANKTEIAMDDGNNSDENVNATDSAAGAVEESQKDEADPMEYDNRKSTGRRRRSKKGKDKSSEADDTQKGVEESHSETFENQSEYIEFKKAPRSKKSTRGMKSKV
ncbi:unnamed protein product [Eruca vesicaria subsp. sativa]|uniref:J domain-containing protein n=1 Tax=Eruca vesicaria subsp. sativa TaxID=29727 RepID=A0ABC8JQ56_ERUVS|nr:unnamed protein product [Eruca vesicaria subsp. sativa]